MTQPKTNSLSQPSTGTNRPSSSMDPKIPVRFLRENFQPGDRIAVVLIQKQTHKVVQRIASMDKIAEREFQAWLRHANASRFEVYVGMNSLKRMLIRAPRKMLPLSVMCTWTSDHNGTSAVQSLVKRDDLPEPNYLVNSSPGKWQVVWKVAGFQRRCATWSVNSEPIPPPRTAAQFCACRVT